MIPNFVLGFLAVVGLAAISVFLLFLFETIRDRRRIARVKREMLRRFAERPKGRILKVGTIVKDILGGEHPWGFEIDCEGRVPTAYLGPNGEFLVAGYTKDELLEMARRPSEFEP